MKDLSVCGLLATAGISAAVLAGTAHATSSTYADPVSDAMLISDMSMPFDELSSDCYFGNSKLYCYSWGFKTYLQTTTRLYNNETVISCAGVKERNHKCFWEMYFEDESVEKNKCCRLEEDMQLDTSLEKESDAKIEVSPSGDRACTCFEEPPLSVAWVDKDSKVVIGSLAERHTCMRLWATGTDSTTWLNEATGKNETQKGFNARYDDSESDEKEGAEKFITSKDVQGNPVQIAVTRPFQKDAALATCKPKSRKQRWQLFAPLGKTDNVYEVAFTEGKNNVFVPVVVRNPELNMCLVALDATTVENDSLESSTNSTSTGGSSSSSPSTPVDTITEQELIEESKGTEAATNAKAKDYTTLGVRPCESEPSGIDFSFEAQFIRKGPHKGFFRLRKKFSRVDKCVALTASGAAELVQCQADLEKNNMNPDMLMYAVNLKGEDRITPDGAWGEISRRRIAIDKAIEENRKTLNDEAAFISDNKSPWNSASQVSAGAAALVTLFALSRM